MKERVQAAEQPPVLCDCGVQGHAQRCSREHALDRGPSSSRWVSGNRWRCLLSLLVAGRCWAGLAWSLCAARGCPQCP